MSTNAYYTPLDVDEDSGSRVHPKRPVRRTTRRTFWILGACGVSLIGVLMYAFGPSETTINDAITKFATTRCPAHCPTDPFVKSGNLHFGLYPNDTRWIPFPREPMDALEHPLSSESTISYTESIPDDALANACPQYMKMLAEGSSEMEWARGKTVMFIGSSHDRNNVDYFCSYVGGKGTSIGGHKGGYCYVEAWDLTIINWFLFGMVDGEFDWFEPGEERPHTFEGRIDKFLLPMMEQYKLKAPNLIIATSLFWDDKFLGTRARHYNSPDYKNNQPFTFSELLWHRSRVHALIHRTRQIYGPEVPIMFRTRHFRKTNDWNRIRHIFQLDQSVRAIGEELGIKLFVWGGKLEGITDEFYDGDQHFQKGKVTWLFGDMMLFYLKRATTTGCWKCHQWRD